MAILTLPRTMERCRDLSAVFARDPENLPFSFLMNGDLIRGIPADWGARREERRADSNMVQTWFSGTHPENGLRIDVDLLEYLDYPVIEWTVWLSQTRTAKAPLVADLKAWDGTLAGEQATLWSCNGDYYSIDGYQPALTRLVPGERLSFAPTGGRPCDQAFPYFRLDLGGEGWSLAVGWPGQWAASFEATAEGVAVCAGQELTHFRLAKGEKVRTPRITLLAWEGGEDEAINAWRRWYMDHVLPKPDGRLLQPKLTCASTEGGEEFTNASEKNQLRLMRKARKLGLDFDIWWIDAGWYPCWHESGEKKWWHTGDWQPDPERFPAGFGKVGREAQKEGADLLVWFEPERIHRGSRMDKEMREWLLFAKNDKGEDDENRLLDLGNPECREWLTKRVGKILTDGHVGVYRQDFNFEPLRFWRQNDAPERQGLRENFHVQGYLQYWDDLLRDHPGLWIDSCSSGGRRNDLETMRRSVPLHYTDYGYGDTHVKLAFNRTLFEWIPYFKGATVTWDDIPEGTDRRFDQSLNRFGIHCGLAAMLYLTIDLNRDDYDFAMAREMVEVWRKAAPYLYGDYYRHTPYAKKDTEWVAWQFDRPDLGSGMFQTIRLAKARKESLTIRLKAVDGTATYRVENPETGEVRTLSGMELKKGFKAVQAQRSGSIWIYQKLEGAEGV